VEDFPAADAAYIPPLLRLPIRSISVWCNSVIPIKLKLVPCSIPDRRYSPTGLQPPIIAFSIMPHPFAYPERDVKARATTNRIDRAKMAYIRCSFHSLAYARHSPQNATQLFIFVASSILVFRSLVARTLRSGAIIPVVVSAQIPSYFLPFKFLQAVNLFFFNEGKPGVA
jgi:hypothetical protein